MNASMRPLPPSSATKASALLLPTRFTVGDASIVTPASPWPLPP